MATGTQRRILITGSNKGIGFAIAARTLGEYPDTFVLLGARDRRRGDAAVQQLVSLGFGGRVKLLLIDPSQDESVANAANEVIAEFGKSPPPLYGLVNNAGSAVGDGAAILEINTKGPRRVDQAFLHLLQPEGRIVYISSGAGPSFVSKCSSARQAFFTDRGATWEGIEKLMQEALSFPRRAQDFEGNGLGPGKGMLNSWYGFSKALVNTYCMEVARSNPHLTVSSCSPGLIATDILGAAGPSFLPVCVKTGIARACMGAKTPEQGAEAPIFSLFSQKVTSGWFYGSDAQRSPLDRPRSPGSEPYSGP